jgi:hypothetical protein
VGSAALTEVTNAKDAKKHPRPYKLLILIMKCPYLDSLKVLPNEPGAA